jgi:Trypsin-co-occurring domain 1
MKRLIAYPLEAGGSVLIEVEDEGGRAVTRGLRPGELVETVSNSFEAAIEAIKPAAIAVVSKLRGFADAPDDLEVEFGLKFAGQAGAFIASASTEAQFHVKMVWKGKPATSAT